MFALLEMYLSLAPKCLHDLFTAVVHFTQAIL